MHCWWECATAQPQQNTVWQFPYKYTLSKHKGNPTLGLMKTYVHNKTYKRRFIQDYPNLKTTQSPSPGEWLNRLWYIHTMEHYSMLKGNELLKPATNQMSLKIIVLSDTHIMCDSICMLFRKDKTQSIEQISGSQGGQGVTTKVTSKRFFFGGEGQ